MILSYTRLPVFFQNLAINLHGLKLNLTRYNRDFRKHLKIYLSNKKTPDTDIQNTSLKKFLEFSKNSDFWKRRFKDFEINFKEKDIYKEIVKLPILDKFTVKDNIDFISVKKKFLKRYKVFSVSTSGTTGSGLVFPQTRLMENKQWAIWWRYRIWNGINMNTWCGYFGGKIIVPIESKKPPFWRYNYPGKQLMFSAYHLNKNTAPYYFSKLREKKITWIHGYPSQIALLAAYIEELGLGNLPDLRIITYGSENLYVHQRQLINRVFNVPIRTHYGLAEGVANISQLPDESFRVDGEFCYVEFIPTEDQERFRIIGTNYSNYAFPLIRYDTGDIAIMKKQNGKDIIVGIDGRSDDYIVRPDGVKVARLGFVFKDQVYVKEAQIYQPDLHNVVFRIVPMDGFRKDIHEKEILNAVRERIGKDVRYSFEYPEKIEKTSAGKIKYVVSDIK